MSGVSSPSPARSGRPTIRAFDPAADFPAAAELIAIAHRHDAIDWAPATDELAHEWSPTPGFRPASDIRIAERDGRAVGLVAVDWRLRGEKVVHNIEIWVRPENRRRGLGSQLLSWAEGRARASIALGDGGPPNVRHEVGGWGDSEVAGHAALARVRGYRVVRYGFEMRRNVAGPIPDAPLPDGLEIRPVRPEDHRRIWDADVEAFADHWERGKRVEEDFVRWFTAPWLDTTLWQVAWDGNEVAGSVLTAIHAAENERLGLRVGWLDHVSTRRPWRRRGLAAALIVSTLRILEDRGMEVAALGVDAENPTGALALYEGLGFRRHKTGIAYRRNLDLDS